jgi:hypothetical protein
MVSGLEREDMAGGGVAEARGAPRGRGSLSFIWPPHAKSDTQVPLTHRCPTCRTEKPRTAYYRNSRSRTGYSDQCKACRADYQRRYIAKLKEKGGNKPREWKVCPGCHFLLRVDKLFYKHGARGVTSRCKNCLAGGDDQYSRRLRRFYDLTPDDYAAMAADQGWACAICRERPATNRRLAVDHCHKSGKVRALLCQPCNVGIGALRDDPGIMTRAIEYLRMHSPPSDVE